MVQMSVEIHLGNFVSSPWLLVWMENKLELLVCLDGEQAGIVSLDEAQAGIVSLDLDGLRSNKRHRRCW